VTGSWGWRTPEGAGRSNAEHTSWRSVMRYTIREWFLKDLGIDIDQIEDEPAPREPPKEDWLDWLHWEPEDDVEEAYWQAEMERRYRLTKVEKDRRAYSHQYTGPGSGKYGHRHRQHKWGRP